MEIASQFEQVIGVDPSPKMIQQANQLNGVDKRIVFQCAPAEKLGFLEDESVDFVSAGELFISITVLATFGGWVMASQLVCRGTSI